MAVIDKKSLDPALDALCEAAGTRQEDVLSLSIVAVNGEVRLTALSVVRDENGAIATTHSDPPAAVTSTKQFVLVTTNEEAPSV